MGERGQTTFDFAIGVSVFLLTIAFVFSFVPGMVQPFTASGQEEMSASNRLDDRLALDALADDEPYVLDVRCTEAFFDEGVSPPPSADCAFDGTTVEDALVLDPRTDVHVSIVGDANDDGTENPLCLSTTGAVAESGCLVTFDGGDSVPNSGVAATATRRVSVGGVHARLVVRVW